MLTVIFCLVWYIFKPQIPKWLEKTLFASLILVDLILETCGLIALYNLFTRL